MLRRFSCIILSDFCTHLVADFGTIDFSNAHNKLTHTRTHTRDNAPHFTADRVANNVADHTTNGHNTLSNNKHPQYRNTNTKS
mmetsp:Transcript_11772/g.21524  ORF Transcript_11772/g.21524 Transcript_11772/m.21524 type:complete len:83 (+) Transcript_11772:252-500(+)